MLKTKLFPNTYLPLYLSNKSCIKGFFQDTQSFNPIAITAGTNALISSSTVASFADSLASSLTSGSKITA